MGTHYEALPVNKPKSEVNHYHKDGPMRFFDNNEENPDAYYEPNSFGGPAKDPSVEEPPMKIDGTAARFAHHPNDVYEQPGNLFRMFDEDQKNRLFNNIAAAMQGAPDDIIQRQLVHFDRVDRTYGDGIRRALKNN